jgi:hypothetical protein
MLSAKQWLETTEMIILILVSSATLHYNITAFKKEMCPGRCKWNGLRRDSAQVTLQTCKPHFFIFRYKLMKKLSKFASDLRLAANCAEKWRLLCRAPVLSRLSLDYSLIFFYLLLTLSLIILRVFQITGHVTDWHFDFMENFTLQLQGTK